MSKRQGAIAFWTGCRDDRATHRELTTENLLGLPLYNEAGEALKKLLIALFMFIEYKILPTCFSAQ